MAGSAWRSQRATAVADATAVDRFVVVEELLRWGASVGHHWVADWQIAPVLLRYGTEEQKRWLLPRICRGELCFASA